MICPDCKGSKTITLLTSVEPCMTCAGTGEIVVVGDGESVNLGDVVTTTTVNVIPDLTTVKVDGVPLADFLQKIRLSYKESSERLRDGRALSAVALSEGTAPLPWVKLPFVGVGSTLVDRHGSKWRWTAGGDWEPIYVLSVPDVEIGWTNGVYDCAKAVKCVRDQYKDHCPEWEALGVAVEALQAMQYPDVLLKLWNHSTSQFPPMPASEQGPVENTTDCPERPIKGPAGHQTAPHGK